MGRAIKTSLTLEFKLLTTMTSYFRDLAKEVRDGGMNFQEMWEVVRGEKKWVRKGRKATHPSTLSSTHYVLIPDSL